MDITQEPLTWLGEHQFANRYIVSAANRYTTTKGEYLVIPCVRHYSKEHQPIIKALRDSGVLTKTVVAGDNQGFVDQYSNYWTREQALVIAEKAGQIGRRGEKVWPKDLLFSEDLY